MELYRKTDARKDDVDELAGRLRKDWSEAVTTWRRREKCPYCGGIIVDLVKKWDGVALPIRNRLERESKNRRLLAVLNA